MMTRVGLGLALLLSACGEATGPTPPASGSATGVVSVDGAPLAGASVQLHSKTTGYNEVSGGFGTVDRVLATAVTGADGSYRAEAPRIDPDVCAGAGSVLVAWGPVRAVAQTGSPCQDRAGVDFALRTDTIAGRVMVNGQPVAGAAIDLRLCHTGNPSVCEASLGAVSTAADGSYELHYVGCYDGGDLLYRLTAEIDVGFAEEGLFLDCLPRRAFDFDVSTTVEVTGTVYLDGAPVGGWEGLVLGMTEPCALAVWECSFTELASAVTDASGSFHVSHQAEGFQCGRLLLKARPPADWAGPAPTPTSPGPNGWERPCGTWPQESFYFVTPS